jgi:hypothetical protein
VATALVGALAASILALLSIPEKPEATQEPQGPSVDRIWRVMGFGVAGSIALLFGIHLRAQDSFGKTPKELSREWKEAGVADSFAVRIAAYERTGIVLGDIRVSDKVLPIAAAATSTSLFFAKPEDCIRLEPRKFPEVNEVLSAWSRSPEPWKSAALAMSKLASDVQFAKLAEFWRFQCEKVSE